MDVSIEPRISGAGRQFHRLTAVSNDGSTIVSFQVGVQPKSSSASFLAVVIEPFQAPVVIAETEIVAPSSSWEFRGEGLWADHICETPFEHWSYGLEAFALRLEDPVELLGRGYGDRVPLGWELEFESDIEPGVADSSDTKFDYAQAGICHGILLFKGREVTFEGPALRQHWYAKSIPDDVAVVAPVSKHRQTSKVAMPVDDGTWWLVTTPGSVRWEYLPD